MADQRWTLLDRVRDKIVPLLANALDDGSFLDNLLSRRCISRSQYDEIRRRSQQSSTEDAIRDLLSILRRTPPSCFDSFCTVLQEGNDRSRKAVYDLITKDVAADMESVERTDAQEERRPKSLLDFVDLAQLRARGETFGRGGSSRVYRETIKKREYVIKEILETDPSRKKAINNETKAFASLKGCENIITFYDMKWDNDYFYLLLEKCDCSLQDAIERKKRLVLRDVLNGMCKGLDFLHTSDPSNVLVHKDLKPANVLLSLANDGKYVAKLADFGTSVCLEDRSSATYTQSGTDGWRPPEAKLKRGERKEYRLRPSYDVYCLGLVYYYTATGGEHPFGFLQYEIWAEEPNYKPNYDALEKLTEKSDKQSDSLSRYESASLLDLVMRMLSFDPEKRPNMASVKKHCFFWDWIKINQFVNKIVSDTESDEGKQRLSILENKEWAKGKWITKLDNEELVGDVNRRKDLKSTGVTGYIKFMRNKVTHWQDDVKRRERKLPYASERSALEYFLNCYPDLLPRVYEVSLDEVPEYLNF